MSENNSISDESYSDDDEEEELDPRIQVSFDPEGVPHNTQDYCLI